MGLIDYLDRKRAAVAALRDYEDMRWKMERAGSVIEAANDRMTSLPSMSSGVSVQGGESGRQGLLDSQIDRKRAAEHGLRCAQEYFREFIPAWERLTPQEQALLRLRYVEYPRDSRWVDVVRERYNIERSEAYRRSDEALDRLAKLMFW
ncbi:MAG: hypothetical protein IJC61_01915 [Oscillospiraceae bacterium]|nr:hypothetical protein [Oscillospiraceae bacterium]MBQ9960088.1 hypothetical protein [Oscillospiraceae bacterium]